MLLYVQLVSAESIARSDVSVAAGAGKTGADVPTSRKVTPAGRWCGAGDQRRSLRRQMLVRHQFKGSTSICPVRSVGVASGKR
jgi:hypothetical protein